MLKFPKFYRSDLFYYRQYFLSLAPLIVALLMFGLYLWIGADQQHLALTGLAVLVTGLLATLVAAADRLRRMFRPLVLVNRAMRRVRSGELQVRVHNISRGEMGELEDGFNAMAEELANAQEMLFERVEQATQEARESMEVVEIRNAELDLARRRAIEASRVKSEFLANMSHEIRTPMNGIIGFTNLLAKTELNEKQQDFLSTIQKSAKSLLRIVDDILDFSQLESGKLILSHEPFSLRECVESAVALWAPQAHGKDLELVSIVYNDVPDHLVGDETRIIQILNNLLGNAVKFTQQGEIVVRVMLDAEEAHRVGITFSVSDTGIGIPLGEQQRLFVAFDQGSATANRLFGGTGLGLSICHSLAEAMDGHVNVTSRVDEGSVFRVTVRLDLDPDAPPARHAPPLNRRGLLIEPHDLSRIALRNSLIDLGLALDDYASFDALDSLNPATYSLLAVGCSSDESAIENSLQQIRSLSADHHLPVIALVSSSDDEVLSRFIEHGASYCLTKPAHLNHLQESVRGCLRGAQIGSPATAIDQKRRDSLPVTAGEAALEQDEDLLSGRLCLAADDHPVNLELITHLLRDMGATVLPAEDGDIAVQIARDEPIDLAFLDVHMPRMNGLEAARQIRALHPGRKLHLVALTADAAGKNQREIERAGIHRFLIKPVTEEALRQTVAELLAGKGTARFIDAGVSKAPRQQWPVRDTAQALRIAGGSHRIASKLFRVLCDELEATIQSMREKLAQNDWAELWQLSHRLHGAAAVCGVPALYHALGDLQPAVSLEDKPTVQILLDQVAQEASRVIESHAQSELD